MEAVLGGRLDNFICANAKDYQLLMRLAQQCKNFKPSCMVVNYNGPAYKYVPPLLNTHTRPRGLWVVMYALGM
jgi:hypothetical protein